MVTRIGAIPPTVHQALMIFGAKKAMLLITCADRSSLMLRGGKCLSFSMALIRMQITMLQKLRRFFNSMFIHLWSLNTSKALA
jgi:hypothetical protein